MYAHDPIKVIRWSADNLKECMTKIGSATEPIMRSSLTDQRVPDYDSMTSSFDYAACNNIMWPGAHVQSISYNLM